MLTVHLADRQASYACKLCLGQVLCSHQDHTEASAQVTYGKAVAMTSITADHCINACPLARGVLAGIHLPKRHDGSDMYIFQRWPIWQPASPQPAYLGAVLLSPHVKLCP